MRKHLIGIATFVIAFSVGIFFVPKYTTEVRNFESQAASRSTEPKLQLSEENFETIEEVENWLIEKPAPKTKIIETGDGFHGNEVLGKNGERWLGLVLDTNSRLQHSTLVIKKVHDPIVDDNESVRTGKSVAVKEKFTPLFLINPASGLKSGPVTTLFKGLTWQEAYADQTSEKEPIEEITSLDKTFNRQFELGGIVYTLKVVRAVTPDGHRILALLLETDDKSQVLQTMRTSYEGERGDREWLESTGQLYWIGDLDRDLKPDFYLSFFVHDNVANHVLLLSSKASKDKLVNLVAQFWTTGC